MVVGSVRTKICEATYLRVDENGSVQFCLLDTAQKDQDLDCGFAFCLGRRQRFKPAPRVGPRSQKRKLDRATPGSGCPTPPSSTVLRVGRAPRPRFNKHSSVALPPGGRRVALLSFSHTHRESSRIYGPSASACEWGGPLRRLARENSKFALLE